MLKVISAIVLLGLTLSVSANDSRHFSKTAPNAHSDYRDDNRYKTTRSSKHYSKHDYNHAYAEPRHSIKHSSRYDNSHYAKHSQFDYRSSHRSEHRPIHQYVQTSHGYRHPAKVTKSHKVFSPLKRHQVLPAHMSYGRVPMRVENRLGRLPSHLMRVAIGRDIAVIHITNRVVHEIIRGLL